MIHGLVLFERSIFVRKEPCFDPLSLRFERLPELEFRMKEREVNIRVLLNAHTTVTVQSLGHEQIRSEMQRNQSESSTKQSLHKSRQRSTTQTPSARQPHDQTVAAEYETIFLSLASLFFDRSSHATGPLIREPMNLCLSSSVNTLFWKKRTWLPSLRCVISADCTSKPK